jgi:hypothetical protein
MESSSDNVVVDDKNNNINNDNDDNESAEDRLNYLRERGVEISTHEERAAAKKSNANVVAPIFEQLAKLSVNDDDDDDDDGSDGSIKFVLIPHDDSKPMRTVKLPSTFTNDHGSRSGDLITTFVKPYFADRRSVDASILQQTATKHFSSGTIQGVGSSDGGGIDMSKISPSAMNAVAAEGSVEVSFVCFVLFVCEDLNVCVFKVFALKFRKELYYDIIAHIKCA